MLHKLAYFTRISVIAEMRAMLDFFVYTVL